jgi:hypothetical protein
MGWPWLHSNGNQKMTPQMSSERNVAHTLKDLYIKFDLSTIGSLEGMLNLP